MAKKKDDNCCAPKAGCCRVESVIGVDERGQMVLPKELRDKAGISPGDKFVAASWEKDDKVCCIFLIRASEMSEMVKGFLGPALKDIAGE